MPDSRAHFSHRETGGHVVDLFWDPDDAGREFRVSVLDRASGEGFVLYPASGTAALRAFHHPFAVLLETQSRERAEWAVAS
jgi:hypothetical protein